MGPLRTQRSSAPLRPKIVVDPGFRGRSGASRARSPAPSAPSLTLIRPTRLESLIRPSPIHGLRNVRGFCGRIRACGRIWGTIVHRILPEARILPDLSGGLRTSAHTGLINRSRPHFCASRSRLRKAGTVRQHSQTLTWFCARVPGGQGRQLGRGAIGWLGLLNQASWLIGGTRGPSSLRARGRRVPCACSSQ